MILDLPDCRIYYEAIGEGPAVVHLHGFELDINHLKRPMELVYQEVPGFRRLYFDLPGMGQTIAHRQLTCAEEMFAVVTQVIDALVGDRPFAVVGGSYGGYLARRLVFERPQQVTGALYVCPVFYATHARRTLPPKTVFEEDPALASRLTPEEYAGFMDMATIATQQTWALHKIDILPGLVRANEPFLTRYVESGYAFESEKDDVVEGFAKPTLILCGRQDHIVGYHDTYRLVESYSRATYCVVDRAGHNLPIEQPALFHRFVTDWLRQLR